MEFTAVLSFALPISLAITGFGSALALGRAVAAGMEATARQPEAANRILVNMVTGCAFIEALTIYTLVFAFLISGKIQ